MGTSARGELPADLARVRGRLEAWREGRNGGRIPQRLWALAVRLAKIHGLSRTAIALRLDYYSLKKQVEAAGIPPSSNNAAFVELPAPVISKQCLFELDNRAGSMRRLQLIGYDTADVERLARGFWSAE